MVRLATLLVCTWCSSFLAVPLSAQYFGQNKVRYKNMDFEVLKTPHFDIHFYPEERAATILAGKMAERWHARLSSVLGHELPPSQPIVLYDSGPAFRQTTVIPGEIAVGTGGVTEGLKRRVVMPFAATLAETDHVLGHELVHAFQYHMTSGPGNSTSGGIPGAATLPLWFIEGMAEYLSVGPIDPNTAMWLRDALQRNMLPSWGDLDDPEYFPYRFGHAFWSYVAGLHGDRITGELLRAAGRARSVDAAIRSVLGMEPSALIERWHDAIRDAYGPVLDRTQPAPQQASAVIRASEDGPALNVSPSASPDGKRLVVFSERDLFSIDLFVVDAQTGRVLRKLTETALSPHIDSIEFIQSSGAWSADSRRFAYATVERGWPNVAVYDFEQDETTRTEFKTVGEIHSLSWSPDGKSIALSAIAGGLTDLYTYDFETKELRRITNDGFAEFQPAWSPSGRFLAFSTDRFGTDLENLTYTGYRLGLIDLQTDRISQLFAFSEGKHIDPQWGDTDDTLFFVADRDGISNAYRLDRRNGVAVQLTTIQTGVSGIGNLSPAIAFSRQTNRLFFSSFRDGRYGLYSLDLDSSPARTSNVEFRNAAFLPPAQRADPVFLGINRQPVSAMVPASSFATEEYDPNLDLTYAAPVSISAGVSSYGGMVGGGTALYFSDLLERHQLVTSFQNIAATSGNFFRNLSGVASYENRESRWTWGVIGGQVPYLGGGYRTSVAEIDGTPAIVEENLNVWQIERQAAGLLAYPFHRAMRMEFTGGYRNIDFAAETRANFYSPSTGEFLGSTTTDLDAPAGLHLGTASAALVYDTSIFGGTSPVWGRRYRFEAGLQGGSLNMTTALADYRHYFRLPGNLAFAVRGMHFGRYGGGAEDGRLQDLFLGYPALIRGYTSQSFTAGECGSAFAQDGSCPAFDQLLGSKIAVGNAELRIPILGGLGLIPSRGIPPVEVAPFFDAAYAWRQNERIPFFQENSREPVRSYGGSLRVNVLGFFVAQFSYVNPMDRPRGWHWEFSIIPGF
jgi:Tol biopolymer transport system component